MTVHRSGTGARWGLALGAALTLTAGCASPPPPAKDTLEALPGNRYTQTNLAATGENYSAPFTLPDMVNAWGDSGHISGWTEPGTDGQIVRHNGPAKDMFDGTAEGMNFFGIALEPGGGDTLWADFGATPQIRQFDKNWRPVPTEGFANPFATGDPLDPANPGRGNTARPGDPAPFNITTVGDRVFVSYATTKAPDGGPATEFDAGEEDSLDAEQEAAAQDRPDRGKVAEFDAAGALVRVLDDQGRLNAPWGVALAPAEFGALGGKLLVGNFAGAGRILAFDDATGEFVDYLRDGEGEPLTVEGLWGLLFGNGESLGDADARYFTAGPEDEKDGLFGALRAAN